MEFDLNTYDVSEMLLAKKVQEGFNTGNIFMGTVVEVRGDQNVRSLEGLKKLNIPIPEPRVMFKEGYEKELIQACTMELIDALKKDTEYLAWYLYYYYVLMSSTIFLVPRWVSWMSRSVKLLKSWGVVNTKDKITDALCMLLEGSDDNVMMATCFYDCVLVEGYNENVVCALYDKDRLEIAIRKGVASHKDSITKRGEGYIDVLESIDEHLVGMHEKGLF